KTLNVIDNSQTESCSHCKKQKILSEFIRSYGDRREIEFEASEILNQLEYIQENENNVLYDLAKLKEQVAIHFATIENNNQKLEFSMTFEFDNEIIYNFQISNNIQETDVQNIILFFLLLIKAESHYYWEVRKIYISQNDTKQ
ncbi:14676_t:CDS:2, partial [Cetraspora pellucida]